MRYFCLLLLCSLPILNALADGKMFSNPRLEPSIPFQEAIIIHEQGQQTLIVQSRWQLTPLANDDSEEAPRLGWVVPVPAIPEVAAIDGYSAQWLFRYFNGNARPRVIEVGPFVFLGLLGLLVALITLSLMSWLPGCRGLRRYIPGGPFRALIYILLVMLFFGILLPPVATRGDGVPIRSGLSLHGEHQVGHYGVQVIAAESADDLIAWLDDEGLAYTSGDRAAFTAHIEAGWYFCVVRLSDPETWTWEQHSALLRGTPDALVLRFPAEQAIYPLALTGSAGHDTEVRLHVLTSGPVADDGRLPRRFAGTINQGFIQHLLGNEPLVDPTDFFAEQPLDVRYQTTLHGTLSPEQMASDMVFHPDPQGRDLRLRRWRW